jgi:hypothetical protein
MTQEIADKCVTLQESIAEMKKHLAYVEEAKEEAKRELSTKVRLYFDCGNFKVSLHGEHMPLPLSAIVDAYAVNVRRKLAALETKFEAL